MEIPFSTFQGHVKHLSLEGFNEIGRRAFSRAFPGIFVTRDWPTQVEQIADYVSGDPNPPRRYAPFFLERERYCAVAQDAGGDDGGTLLREVLAYRDWKRE